MVAIAQLGDDRRDLRPRPDRRTSPRRGKRGRTQAQPRGAKKLPAVKAASPTVVRHRLVPHIERSHNPPQSAVTLLWFNKCATRGQAGSPRNAGRTAHARRTGFSLTETPVGVEPT